MDRTDHLVEIVGRVVEAYVDLCEDLDDLDTDALTEQIVHAIERS